MERELICVDNFTVTVVLIAVLYFAFGILVASLFNKK